MLAVRIVSKSIAGSKACSTRAGSKVADGQRRVGWQAGRGLEEPQHDLTKGGNACNVEAACVDAGEPTQRVLSGVSMDTHRSTVSNSYHSNIST